MVGREQDPSLNGTGPYGPMITEEQPTDSSTSDSLPTEASVNAETPQGTGQKPSLKSRFDKKFTLELDFRDLFPPRQKKLPKAKGTTGPTNLITRRKVLLGGLGLTGTVLACGVLPRAIVPTTHPDPEKTPAPTQGPTAKPTPKDTPAPSPKPPEVLKDPPPALITEKNLTDAMSKVGGEGSITVTPSPDKKEERSINDLVIATEKMWGTKFKFENIAKDPVLVLKFWTTLLESVETEQSKKYIVKKMEEYFQSAKSDDGQGIHFVHFEKTDPKEHVLINGYPQNYPLRVGTKPTIIGVTPDKKNAIIVTSLYDQPDGGASHLSVVSIPVAIQPNEIGYSLKHMVDENGGTLDTTRPDGIYLTMNGVTVALNSIDTSLADKLTAEAGSAFFDTDKSTGKPFANHVARAPSKEFIASLSLKKGDTPTIVADFSMREVDMFAPDPSGKGTVVVARQTYDQKTNEWVWNAEKPVEKPVLKVEGSKFKDANGADVVLEGAVIPRFVFKGNPEGNLEIFRREVDILTDMGANFVVVEWNSGDESIGDPSYRKSLVEGLEYAKGKGFYVELSLHSRGWKPNSTWENIQINTLDEQIKSDWKKLFVDLALTERIAKCVDIFGVLSEAEKNASSSRPSLNDPILEATIGAIRSDIKNSNAICAISGADWGRDASELMGTSPTVPNNNNRIVEVHPYPKEDGSSNDGFYTWVNQLREAGYLLFVGEMGFIGSQDYNKKLVEFLDKNGISYAFYAIDVTGGDNQHIYNQNGITQNGKLAQQHFGLNK